jgi:hypothetical protein
VIGDRPAAGDYPSTTRSAELLFGHGGAWSYVKTFGTPVDVDARDLPIDLASGPSEILKTADGQEVTKTEFFAEDNEGNEEE